MKALYWQHRRKLGYKTPPCTALHSLESILNKESEGQENTLFSKEDQADSDEDIPDLVFRKAILPGHTGDFDTDFPPSPKVFKGGKGAKGKCKKSSTNVSKGDFSQSVSVPKGNVGVASEGDNPAILTNTCTVDTVNDSSSPGRLSDLDMNGNIQPSGRMTTSAPFEIEKLSGGQFDETLHLTHPGNKKMMRVCHLLL